MARTAPIPNIPPIPGMNPGVWVAAGAGGGGGGSGSAGNGSGDGQGAGSGSGDGSPNGGGQNGAACGPGSGGGCPNPSHGGGGGTQAGDPIDPSCGRMYTVPVVDLALPGPLQFAIERSYSTASVDTDVGLGPGFSHSLAFSIEERRRTLRVNQPSAAPTRVGRPKMGESVRLTCGELTRHPTGYTLARGRVVRVFGLRQGRSYLLTRIIDQNGNSIELVYERNVLQQVIDSAGRIIRVRRLSTGRIGAFEVQNLSDNGRWTAFRNYEYDSAGLLVAAYDAKGYAERYEYDNTKRMIRRTEPGGLVAEYRYDRSGRCTETWCHRQENDALDPEVPELLADGLTPAKGFLHVKIDYGVDMTDVVTSRATRRVDGNAQHKADKVVFGGGLHANQFDEAGELLSYVDPLENAWEFPRDPSGRLLAEINPLGGRTDYQYGKDGQLESMIDAAGGSARFSRDSRGNSTSIDDSAGNVAGFHYDSRGLMTEASLPNGGLTRMSYDDLGNRVEVTEPDGTTRRIQYDFLGRVTSATDAAGQVTKYTYDECGRLLQKTGPTGATVRYEYDADGKLIATTDADHRTTRLRWGGFHVVTEVVRPDGQVVRYRYDREQDLVRIINEAGEEHRLIRRGEGRIVEERTFDGRVIRYRHDLLGRVVGMNSGQGWILYEYDAQGRLIAKTFPDDTQHTFEYDPVGRLLRVVTGAVTTDYAYDLRGNISRETTTHGGDSVATEYQYDELGKVVKRTGPGGTLELRRDVVGRPVDVRWNGAPALRYGYDATGAEVQRALPGGGRIESRHSPSGQLTVQDVFGPKAAAVRSEEPPWVGPMPPDTALRRMYGWSMGGELLGVDDYQGGHSALARDANGRVYARQTSTGQNEFFSYSPTGDLAIPGEVTAYEAGGRPKERGAVEYLYDLWGRVSEKRIRTALGVESYLFSWDASGQLEAVDTPQGEHISFVYDAFARRLQKLVQKNGQLVKRIRYAWDGDVLVNEICEKAAAAGDPVVEERSYGVIPGELTPFGDCIKTGQQDQHRWYLFDPNGMPDALVGADGTILGELHPTLYGKVDPAHTDLTPLRFPGHYHDTETGLFFNRHRFYDPDSGCYLSPEPLGLEGSLKAYAYVDHYPSDAIDPDGFARMVATVRRKDGSTVTANSGGTPVLHPAVQAALPPSNARGANVPVQPSSCAEPQALSGHLNDWEERNKPRTCRPDDPNWRNNLKSALGEIDPNGGISSTMSGTPRAACPNCSQTVPRLWALAGQHPPNGVLAPGQHAQGHPSRTTSGPTTPPPKDFTRNAAQNQQASTNAYGQQNLGVWNHDGNQWRRQPTR